MTDKLDTALALAARGFPVFPIKAGAKFPPLWRDWPNRATKEPNRATSTNSEQIGSKLVDKWPENANIGIHCKGLVVLDVDVRADGDNSLAKLELTNGLPPTLTTRTPTGGRHLFYRLPEGHTGVPNGANKLGPGIDIKSTNGYVLAPGSEVEAGRYRFEADVPIVDAPEWLLLELGTSVPKKGMSTNSGQVEIVDASEEIVLRANEWLAKQPKGDEAFKTACGLRDFGVSETQATTLLAEHDGRPIDTLRPKVEHAYRYAQNEPGARTASAEDFPVVEQPAPKPRPKLLRLTELAAQPSGTGYLIKGLLQRRSHAVMYGAPGEGKTFVALDMAYHVAAGKEWQNNKVHSGTVFYLAYEGIGGLAKRAAALTRLHGEDDAPFYLVSADYNLRDAAGRKALGEDIATLPTKPVLIIIDTLARAMKGGDENSAQDMGALNDSVSALIQSTGACVLLIHHSGKNKASGARGSSALLGAIDTEIEIDARQIFTRKQRDVEPAHPLGFKLTPVSVGVDADGDAVTSCYVEPATPIIERMAGLSENARLGFEVLADLSPDNEAVDGDRWHSKCREFLPQQDAAARKAFYRIRSTLVKRGLVEETPNGRFQRRLE
jgi:hypothetical protein